MLAGTDGHWYALASESSSPVVLGNCGATAVETSHSCRIVSKVLIYLLLSSTKYKYVERNVRTPYLQVTFLLTKHLVCTHSPSPPPHPHPNSLQTPLCPPPPLQKISKKFHHSIFVETSGGGSAPPTYPTVLTSTCAIRLLYSVQSTQYVSIYCTYEWKYCISMYHNYLHSVTARVQDQTEE